jgi:hypothetical protein
MARYRSSDSAGKAIRRCPPRKSALANSAVRAGTGWRTVGGSSPHHEFELADVSCTPTLCMVVGPNAGRPAAYLWRF